MLPANSAHTRKWVKATVTDFAEEVLGRLRKLSPFYEDADVGVLKLKDESCWAAFGPKGTGYRRKAHQSLSVQANGIEVFVNIELKEATDKLKRLAREAGRASRRTSAPLRRRNPSS